MKKNLTVLSIEDIDKCCGCSACFNACPSGAITMKENFEGFLYPTIDEEKCTNCGLCKKSCPILNHEYKNSDKPTCVAYMASDEIRAKSTSGGAFYVLAKEFVNNGDYVAGAVWDNNFKVKHIVSNNIEDIEKMRGSKYLQSDIKNCYKEIKKLLKDKKVLFSGTPCQVAGLKSYLGKEYDNLFYIDIICHGTPSPRVFKKYIKEEHLLNVGEKWLNTNFRDKSNGWNPYLITTATSNANRSAPAKNDNYIKAFLKNLCLRKSCTTCAFAKIPRQGDITIGDFWGIDKHNETKECSDNKGTSLILINNEKSEFLTKIIKNNSKFYKSAPLEYATGDNKNLIQPSKLNPNRKLFFELLNKKSIRELIDICLNDKADYFIVNYWDSKFNYGAMLTAYAIQELVKSCGYVPKLFNNGERTRKSWYLGSWVEKFANDYLDVTNVLDFEKANLLSKSLKGVILGSDQVLRIKYMEKSMKKYLLGWVDSNTRKIAISPSFGFDKKNYLENEKPSGKQLSMMKSFLSNFDYLSCREESGKEIYKDLFNVESDMLLDPVFLIPKEKYDKIIEQGKINAENKIVTYVLEQNNTKYIDFRKTLNSDEIIDLNRYTHSLNDWLKALKECRIFVTDSFHGVCFCLIYNKPFIYIENCKRGSSRFKSLNDLFELDDFILKQNNKANETTNIGFDRINVLLKSELDRCLRIIDKIFSENHSNNTKKEIKYHNLPDFKYLKTCFSYKRAKFLFKHAKPSKKQHYKDKYTKYKYDLDWNF